ncbi:hypothetical protein GQ53DRAFT_739821 [Thozetella sp. PMI_491]|nr:hypothetical protein GQ53DRAFT_739821 [Thozetella sp. PMI_491]
MPRKRVRLGSVANHEGNSVSPPPRPHPPPPSHEPTKVPGVRRKKRSTTACTLCRTRKVKCDNVRPSCGFCIGKNALCVYPSDNDAGEGKDDPETREIISRLGELKDLLLSSSRLDRETLPPNHGPLSAAENDSQWPAAAITNSEVVEQAKPHFSDASHFKMACESILRWPAFKGVLRDEEMSIQSFLLESDADLDPTFGMFDQDPPFPPPPDVRTPAPSPPGSRHHGVREEDFVPLCDKFLATVNSRNPVVDGPELHTYASHYSKSGLGWDGQSCLVLLACAIASANESWHPATLSSHDFTANDEQAVRGCNVATAEAYFLAAKQRIGLLNSSLLDIQCLFLASIYERCLMRPLRSWHLLHRASSCLQTLILRRVRWHSQLGNRRAQLLEQRLYWSCVKAECEFTSHIPLPLSGIINLTYPGLFPSPPLSLQVARQEGGTEGSHNTSRPETRGVRDDECSWLFYLADLSVRRRMVDAADVLYRDGEARWLHDLTSLLKEHAESQEQIRVWYSCLPDPIKFDFAQFPTEELGQVLRGRFELWKELICRPLLYYVLHATSVTDHAEYARAMSIAQESISLCTDYIENMSRRLFQRHGGSWFMARTTFSCAMMIIAVVISGSKLNAPSNWMDLVRCACRVLAFWGRETPDIKWMRSVLYNAFFGTCRRKDISVAEDYLV